MSQAIALAVPGLRRESELLSAAAAAGLDIRRRCVDAADLLGACLGAPGLTAVITAQLPRLSADVVARLQACGCRVIAIATGPDDRVTLEPLGVDAVLEVGDDPRDVLAALTREMSEERASADRALPAGEPEPVESSSGEGRLIAVWGPPGAPGRTTAAVMIARGLAERARTLIVDLDVLAPSLALQLGLVDELSGVILACRHAEAGSLSARTLQSCVSALSARLHALTGVPHARRCAEIRATALERVLHQVRQDYAYVVIDMGATLPSGSIGRTVIADISTTALATADVVVAVCNSEPLGVARFLADLPDLAEQHAPIIGTIAGGSLREQARTLLGEEARRLGIEMPIADLEADPRSLASDVRRGRPVASRRCGVRGARTPSRLIELVA